MGKAAMQAARQPSAAQTLRPISTGSERMCSSWIPERQKTSQAMLHRTNMTQAARDGRTATAASRWRARYRSHAASGATRKPCAPAVLSLDQKSQSACELGQYVKTANTGSAAVNTRLRGADSGCCIGWSVLLLCFTKLTSRRCLFQEASAGASADDSM